MSEVSEVRHEVSLAGLGWAGRREVDPVLGADRDARVIIIHHM